MMKKRKQKEKKKSSINMIKKYAKKQIEIDLDEYARKKYKKKRGQKKLIPKYRISSNKFPLGAY